MPSHTNGANGYHAEKKHILLNAFDMSTVGHLSPGQWKVSHSESRRHTPSSHMPLKEPE